jgi:hypothetical protein
MHLRDVICFLCNLSIHVHEFEIWWSLGRKRTLGTLNFHRSVPRPTSPMPSSPREMVPVETVEAPPLVGAVGASATLHVDDGCAKEAEPQLKDASDPAALTPRSPRGPCCSPSQEATLDEAMSIPKSSNIVNLGARVLGLSGYPRMPLQPTSWRRLVGGAESTCSWVATVHRLLKERWTMVGQDVLQLAQVSPRMERRGFST